MTHGSLFSGIGGFDLAAEWMGWKNVFHCEWNEFGQKVLKYYWPNAESFTDITKTDFTKYANKIDILTGGFPCQPYSQAGKRLGKEDDRHLWPEMLRAIREVKPSWVVGENVYGLVNWSRGLVFHEVQTDLEAEGYEVWPFLLPACGINAPHRRDRIWFVAYTNVSNEKHNGRKNNEEKREIWRDKKINVSGELSCNGIIANSTSIGLCKHSEKQRLFFETFGTSVGMVQKNATNSTSSRWGQTWGQRKSRQFNKKGKDCNWETFPTVSPICIGDDGLSNRLDSITFSKWRNESIKAGGNAIVPQVVYQIFKTIELYEHQRTSNKTNRNDL